MIPHLDPCLNPNLQEVTLPVMPTVNGRGEYTFGQVDVFEEAFRQSITTGLSNNVLTAAVQRYGNNLIYDTVRDLNNDFLQRDWIKDEIAKTEILKPRLDAGPITPFEFAQFLSTNSYTPGQIVEAYNSKGARFVQELDDFYRGDFGKSIMGGFCSLFSNIFGAINGFFNLIGSIQGLINDALTFINKIKNLEDPIKAFFDKLKVKALIEAIKEKIAKTVEKVIEKVKKAIQNFNPAKILADVKSFVENKVLAKVQELKEAAEKFFSKENIENLKKKIKGLIDYAVGLFENPSLEEIQFLIMRICGFAAGIEGLIKGMKGPLDDFQNRYQEAINNLQNASNRILGESIRSGAIRLEEEVRQNLINTARDDWNRQSNARVAAAAAGAEIPDSIPSGGMTPEEATSMPTWDAILEQNGESSPWIVINNKNDWLISQEGPGYWYETEQDARVKLYRLWQVLKNEGIVRDRLRLNCGYRSPATNAAMARNNSNVAKASQHMQGKAFDISWSGFNKSDSVLNKVETLARGVGFNGVGFYNTFVHVDTRSWTAKWDVRT